MTKLIEWFYSFYNWIADCLREPKVEVKPKLIIYQPKKVVKKKTTKRKSPVKKVKAK